MDAKVLIIAIGVLLGIGMLSVLFIVVPWVWERGITNWKDLLMDDGLVIMALILFVYGFYMNTKMH